MSNHEKLEKLKHDLQMKRKLLANTNPFTQKDWQNSLFKEIKELNKKINLLIEEITNEGRKDLQNERI